MLERIVEKRKGKVQARALLILSGLVEDKRRTELEDRLIVGYPDTTYAFDVLWRRGWASLDGRKPDEAVRLWKQAYAPGMDGARRTRILDRRAHV